jgi:hypothetical protein
MYHTVVRKRNFICNSFESYFSKGVKMKNILFIISVLGTIATLACSNANALLLSGLDIIAAPGSVEDKAPNGATNGNMQAFNEAQGVFLTTDLAVDGGFVLAGTEVNSHMIFLNRNEKIHLENLKIKWIFDGKILGVMSDTAGVLESNSNELLGAEFTYYPGGIDSRGLEGGDKYNFVDNTLTVSMKVNEPGDWIRVVTASVAPVPEPSTILLFATVLVGLAGITKRKRKQT